MSDTDGARKPKRRKGPRKSQRQRQREETRVRIRERVNQRKRADPNSALSNIEKFPKMQVTELYGVWKNCLRKIDDPLNVEWHLNALAILDAVEAEWESRAKGFVADDDYFEWPTTEAPGGDGSLKEVMTVTEGMLGSLEYRVGKTRGEPQSLRKAILVRVFTGRLPPLVSRDYMLGWGAPNSAQRLKKIADSIAAFARTAKRRKGADLDDAIREWKSDLQYLFDEYYVGRFGFAWPRITYPTLGADLEFRIADTITDSLSKLTAQEQEAVKTTAFDLQMNASAPGLSFHKLDRAKDSNFWSVRVNADIRLIVHRTASTLRRLSNSFALFVCSACAGIASCCPVQPFNPGKRPSESSHSCLLQR